MDLNLFNKALVMKMVWQLAADEDRIWIKIMKAKYYSRGGFWAVERITDASALWRNIQRLKPELKNQVQWQIGDGTQIPAINQPWFHVWEIKQILTNMQRDMTVSDLYDQHHNSWRITQIEEIFGIGAVQSITEDVKRPGSSPLVKDNLIWKLSVNGKYTTKGGYAQMVKMLPTVQYSPIKKQGLDFNLELARYYTSGPGFSLESDAGWLGNAK